MRSTVASCRFRRRLATSFPGRRARFGAVCPSWGRRRGAHRLRSQRLATSRPRRPHSSRSRGTHAKRPHAARPAQTPISPPPFARCPVLNVTPSHTRPCLLTRPLIPVRGFLCRTVPRRRFQARLVRPWLVPTRPERSWAVSSAPGPSRFRVRPGLLGVGRVFGASCCGSCSSSPLAGCVRFRSCRRRVPFRPGRPCRRRALPWCGLRCGRQAVACGRRRAVPPVCPPRTLETEL